MGSVEDPQALNGSFSADWNGVSNQNDRLQGPIAIVGMGMRLPGGIHSAEELWTLLCEKRTTRCKVPSDRYNLSAFHSPSGKVGFVGMEYGHFLADTDNIRHMDTSFFSMSKKEVDILDPQQRMLLEVVYELMESSGQVHWRGGNVGCYVGVWGEDWVDLHGKETQDSGMYRIAGGHDFAISNRISYEYDLKGPSFTIKSGCSSSMIALHEAVRAIRAGDCNSAIVAGTNLILSPTMSIAMTEQGVLSPDGSCKSFDISANGYSRAEAINAIYIKRLGDAIQDGDSIRAIIRATASNCDGKTPGMSMPSSESHEAMIRRAYSEARLEPSRTAFIEAHATGTAVGDPLEAAAIARVFGGHTGVYIGSVKPNLGHSEGASGINSIMKAVLALEKRLIPPNINFFTPNPKIPFEAANMTVAVEPTPWPTSKALRVSVNSFGIGGANAHVILDSMASFGLEQPISTSNGVVKDRRSSLSKFLLVLSAANSGSLKRSIAEHQWYIENNRSKMKDVSYTLCNRREHLSNRAFCVINESSTLQFSPITKARLPPQITMVFTGQGAQWAGMAKELIQDYPIFRDDLSSLNTVLSRLETPPSWNITDELMKTDSLNNLGKAEYAQPLVTAIQVALVNLLRTWGIFPAAVVGHSSGEIAAAYAAQAITAEDAIIIAYYRGQVTRSFAKLGGMAAVGLGRDEVTPFLVPGIVIGCENSPTSVTLSGDKEALQVVYQNIKDEMPEVFLRLLKVEMAYHSHHMRELGELYEALLQSKLKSKSPTVPFFSSVKGKMIRGSAQFDARYWRENLESPVLFHSAVKILLETRSQDQLFLEIGPHGALGGPLRQILNATVRSSDVYVTALNRRKDCAESILKMAGELHLHGIDVNFKKISPAGAVLTDLPLYQWRHDQEYWSESRVSKDWRFRKFPHHEILGSRTMEGNDLQPEWRNVLRLEDVSWLRDHQIVEDIVFPCAGYLCIAGEGMRQLSSIADYTIRNVNIQTALVLSDSRPVEMITSFRPVRLTTVLNSSWWDFTICSYNGTVWMKHCIGQIRAGKENAIAARSIAKLPRPIPAPYPAIKKIGLKYGPAFQGLDQVSVLPKKMTAVATLILPETSESFYALHPTTIDHCLQLFLIAKCDGIFRHFQKLCVPTSIQELYICSMQANALTMVEAVAASNGSGMISGDAMATSGGEVILSLLQGKFSPLEDEILVDKSDTIGGARLQWKPDLDFVKIDSLVRPRDTSKEETKRLEKLAVLSIIEIAQRVSGIETNAKHLQKFRSWISFQTSRASENEYDFRSDINSFLAFDTKERRLLLANLIREASMTEIAPASQLVSRIVEHCEDIIHGHIDGKETLLSENGLTNFYNWLESRTNCVEFFAAAGHAKPTLRVLEIGAGTGGTTAVVLKGLTSANDQMYSKYTYSDVSSDLFVDAQERFKDYQGMEYKILDISRDPGDQGFGNASYDLIVAANVSHATPNIHKTLLHVRKLLAPQGYLFLQEFSPQRQIVNLIMGILPGWWAGEGEGRPNESYITPERWDMALKGAGFSGVESTIYDGAEPYQLMANIISRPARLIRSLQRVTLLHRDGIMSSYLEDLRRSLAAQGFHIDTCTLQEIPPAGQDIISLVEIETPLFNTISGAELADFQQIVRNLGANGILWVTRQTQIACSDPRFSLCLGLARTLRSELSIPLATLEVDCVDGNTWLPIVDVFKKFQDRDIEGSVDPDYEFALSEGIIKIGRYHAVSVLQELELADPHPNALKLEIGRLGLLQTLKWVPYDLSPLGTDEVVVDPRCVGLNFRDILVSMGILEAGAAGLGLEGSGVVSKVGSRVTDLKVGDRVFYLDQSCFATRLTISALRCAKIPSNLSWEEAATMPCVYATIIHSLLNIGGLKKGHTVLIHSACGGIGLAAIQMCQSIGGVEVYVTVGNEEKQQYLKDTFSIESDHIFNSRDTSFLPAVKAATNGRGVDLVLNSLSGELLHASWKCVAEFGKMLEIGKRDFVGKAQLNMDLFEANRSFFGIDLARFDASKCQPLLAKTVKLFEAGLIKPILPMTVFSGVTVEDSFRYMQKGAHLGKIVVSIPEAREEVPLTRTMPKLQLDPDASYLLVGGLGGLGRAVSTWMVESGARHLIYLSRSAGKSESDRTFFRELKSQDCSVQAFSGDVSSLADVETIVKTACKPIKGVIQMAMVLRDGSFLEMSHSDWETATKPKVEGTWNLHNALPKELDFFVATSSITGSFGHLGQANYSAANTFLDAFVKYRRSQGLPASVLDIGMMEDIGYISQNPSIQEALQATGTSFLNEEELLHSLHWAIVKSKSNDSASDGQLAIGVRSHKPLTDSSTRVIWKRDARMGAYRNVEISSAISTNSATDQIKTFMRSVEADPSVLDHKASVHLLANEIGTRIYTFMLQPVDELEVSQSLAALGVDSLVTIEIRNWMKRSFGGLEFSTLEILNAGTIEALGALAVEGLKKKFETRIR